MQDILNLNTKTLLQPQPTGEKFPYIDGFLSFCLRIIIHHGKAT
jgi:hypothetical protein